jgi:SAM-dependent methyltransferase
MAKVSPFDENATAYDTWFDENRSLYQAELEAVKDFIPLDGMGVEIGVGTGRFAAPLGITIGAEPSHKMAELARQRGAEVFECVAEALPFADATFDFALMVTVVYFLEDVTRAFREVRRILKADGVLIVGFVDRESELGRQYSQMKEQSRFYREATFYSVAELEGRLTEAGFFGFNYRQTLFPGQAALQSVEEGYGKGSFVVVRANKNRGGHQ